MLGPLATQYGEQVMATTIHYTTRENIKRRTILTVLAEQTIGEAEFAGALVGVTATITGVEFIFASGLRRPRPIIHEPPASEQVSHWSKEVPDGVEELGLGHLDTGQGNHQDKELSVGCWEYFHVD